MTGTRPSAVSPAAEIGTYEGSRPEYAGDLRKLESWGIAPIPETGRYGAVWRMFTTWLTPNMEISAIFIGTLGPLLGLSFGLTATALVTGIVLGSLPVAALCTWGPLTGTGQIPLARLPFGRSIVLPGTVQWISAIGWIAIGSLFGAQAAHLLFHVPFWVAALIVLILTMFISILGYEATIQAEKWGAFIMPVLFILITVEILRHHITLAHNTAHGGALAGAFVLMVTISASGSFSWSTYGSDYSRYLPVNASRRGVFWYSLAGLCVAYIWLGTIGAAGASVLSSQTAAGIRSLMGGGLLGVLALAIIVLAAVVSSVMNDYSASLAFQSIEARVKRPVLSVVAAAIAFVLVLWMNAGSTATRFQNILLFTAYWCAPFVAIVVIDWRDHKAKYTASYTAKAMLWRNLRPGWPALLAFVGGFAAMVPFMNTSLIVGPAAKALDGADIAYLVGFVVTGTLYYLLRRVPAFRERPELPTAPAVATAP
jgi:NCS1 family nucleobase:cation symporter-1